jgi:hypothetical protein
MKKNIKELNRRDVISKTIDLVQSYAVGEGFDFAEDFRDGDLIFWRRIDLFQMMDQMVLAIGGYGNPIKTIDVTMYGEDCDKEAVEQLINNYFNEETMGDSCYVENVEIELDYRTLDRQKLLELTIAYDHYICENEFNLDWAPVSLTEFYNHDFQELLDSGNGGMM